MIPFTLFLFTGLVACNLPAKSGITPTLSVTQAYQTIAVRLTQSVGLITPTQTAPNQVTTTPLPTVTPKSIPTQLPVTLTATAICDRAAGGADIDVTIPDETQLLPGQSFTKVWRLTNTGTCTWTNSYAVVWFSGEKLGAPVSVNLSGSVAPGQTVDLGVDMVAPQEAGSYKSYWKLRNASNVLFGIGPNGSASFWVWIVVVQPTTLTPTPTVSATLSPTLTPTTPIKAIGPATLNLGDALDLDTNTVNGSGADLSYQLNNLMHSLDPISSAAMTVVGSAQPSLTTCQSVTLSADPVVVDTVPVGTYLCYRTDGALPGWLQITGFDAITGILNLQIYTWAIP